MPGDKHSVEEGADQTGIEEDLQDKRVESSVSDGTRPLELPSTDTQVAR